MWYLRHCAYVKPRGCSVIYRVSCFSGERVKIMSNFHEVVSKVKTKDGSLFDSEKEAENYIVDSICEDINEIIKMGKFYDLKFRDLTAIIELLAGDIQAIKRLNSILQKHIES